jgi:hypothetical protein
MNAKPKGNQAVRIIKLLAFFVTLFLCVSYFIGGVSPPTDSMLSDLSYCD